MLKAIEVQDLTRRYGYRTALKKVSFSFDQTGSHALFGANGAGKTTLIRVLSTLLHPNDGIVSIMGLDYDEDQIQIKKLIGLVGDKPLLYAELTGRENLEYYGKLYGVNKDELNERIEEMSERFEVKKWLDEQTKILSTGLRKRFDIIRSVVHSPKLYLLDEPFSGLDKDSTEVFLDYLNEYNKDMTVVVTTHNLSLGTKICSDFLTLRKGEVLSQGPISEFDGVI